MAGKRTFEADQRCLRVTIAVTGSGPTKWLVTYVSNEKGAERQLEAILDRGEWAQTMRTPDDAVKALAWLARKLWEEMEARNG